MNLEDLYNGLGTAKCYTLQTIFLIVKKFTFLTMSNIVDKVYI